MWFWELNLGPLREQPVLLTFKPSLQPQKHSFHCIDVLWSICSSHLEGRVHYFRITNQFSHSLNYSGNFFELFVEILKLWNCHLDGLAAYLARVICHLQHHCHVRILERSAAVRAHSHAQFPLKIYKLARASSRKHFMFGPLSKDPLDFVMENFISFPRLISLPFPTKNK